MKSLIMSFRSASLANRVIWAVEMLAVVFVAVLLASEKAHAQAGNIYAPYQAQTAGEVIPALVLQVSIKEVEASSQARAAGAAVGGVLGIALAGRAGGSQNRFAVATAAGVVGGLLGERSASTLAGTRAQEIVLQTQGQNPRTLVIVQPAPYDGVAVGEPVYVTVVNGAYRVIRRVAL